MNIKEADCEMKSEVKALQQKVEKDADERVPESQAEIDSAAAQANALIGQSTTDLSGAIAEGTDELDQKVQGASMALSGPLAEAEAHVNKDKTLASSLAAQTAGAVSQVTSAANQAEKIQKEAADEATKSQFDMNLGLQELDMALKFGSSSMAFWRRARWRRFRRSCPVWCRSSSSPCGSTCPPPCGRSARPCRRRRSTRATRSRTSRCS